MGMGILVLSLGAILGIAALGLAWRRRTRVLEDDAAREPSPYAWPLCIAIALMAFYAATSLMRVGNAFLQGGDEYCRAEFALEWSERPFFATHMHIWLSGQAIVLGALHRLLGNMRMIVALTCLAGYSAMIYFAMSLARRLWNSAMAGLFAGLLVATQEVVMWGCINPHAEVFFFPALLAAMDAWLAGWMALRASNGSPARPARAEGLFLFSAACVGFGNAFRYEMWYLGSVLGLFLLFRLLRLLSTPGRRSLAWMPILGGLLIAAFPVAWMVSSVVHLGSPLAFLENHAKMNLDTNNVHDFSSPLRMFVAYPVALWKDHWWMLALPIAGIVFALVARRRRPLAFLAALALLFLVAMTISVRGGIGSSYRPRFTMFVLLPLICVGSGPLALLWNETSAKAKWAARFLVAVFVLLAMSDSFYRGRYTYPNAWRVDRGVLEVMQGLERELDPGRPVPSYYIQTPDVPLAIYPHDDFGIYWMARYHSYWPAKVWGLFDPKTLQDSFGWAPVGTHYLIMRPIPPVEFPARMRRIAVMEPFELWELGPWNSPKPHGADSAKGESQ